MSYQVIARKWRPQNFSELVGQQHVSQTLVNSLKSGRLHHALLFTGPRGTGKTSSARIVAKSLRCTDAVDFQPCNKCNDCLEVTAGNSINVIEIDGASNNGVDSIRDLRETISFFPTSGKYKVYIIDEVHMLSGSAFNALLKTLEEPPEHVVFVLATTEVQKIPQTILSRCQRFDFRSIALKTIVQKLKSICDHEKIKYEEEAIWSLARQGAGSMRDSESLLDQVLNFSNLELTVQSVVENLGLSDSRLLLETLSALCDRNSQVVLSLIKKIKGSGLNPSHFLKDLLHSIRNLLLIKLNSDLDSQLDLSDFEVQFLKDLSEKISNEDIHLLFDMCLKGCDDLTKTTEVQITFEMVLLRMAIAPYVAQISSSLQSNNSSDSNPTKISAAAAKPNPTASTVSMSSGAPTASSSLRPSVMTNTIDSNLSSQERWIKAVHFMKNADPMFTAKIENLAISGEKERNLEFSVPTSLSFIKEQLADSAMHKKMQSLIDRYWGPGYTFNIRLAQQGVKITTPQQLDQSKKIVSEEEFKQKIAEDPQVKAATLALKGKIKSVKRMTKDSI